MHEPLPFGRYLLLTRIGVGGMAEVHLARQAGPAGFEKLLVIKRLLPELAWDPDMADQFVEEARVAANLSHGNIVPVFDFGEVEGSYYIAMEYVEGKNLRALMVRLKKLQRELPLPAALFITAEVLRGLEYAHSRKARDGQPLNIVHRDVSPQNVALSYHGDVKVLDFGIAKSASREYRTQAGFVKGKIRYMAPEQAREDRLDKRTDVFAVGAMLHEMLCGRREMPDQTKESLRAWLERAEFVAPSAVNKYVGPDLDAIVLKAVAANPNERYASAGEMERALRAYLARRYEDYGGQDLAILLKDAFSSEIEAERTWIQRTLADAPDAGNGAAGGDMFVDKSVTRLDLEDEPTEQVDSDSLALGASASQIGPAASKAELSQVNIADARRAKSPAGAQKNELWEEKRKPTRRSSTGRYIALLIIPLVLAGAAYGLYRLVDAGVISLTQATPTPTPQPTVESSPTPTQVVASSPTPRPTHRPTPTRTRVVVTTRTPTPVRARGYLSINLTGNWGRVYIDDQYIGTTPIIRQPVPAGVHVVKVTRGKKVWKERVYVEPNGSKTLVPQL